MSRLANKPIIVPKSVALNIQPDYVEVKGAKNVFRVALASHLKLLVEPEGVFIKINHDSLEQNKKTKLRKLHKELNSMVGTVWANLKNAIIGVSDGFVKKLDLVGVGYRVQVQGDKINFTLGFAHPVVYALPKDVKAEAPSQTELVLSSHSFELLGQVAAEIRAFRPPECYKGKGIKYAGEKIVLKETKKK